MNTPQKPIAIAIHGGAGVIQRSQMSPSKELLYRQELEKVIDVAFEMLRNAEKALDVVEKAVSMLEDCPLFNAGKGAVFTNKETNELDASIMDGSTLNAGAVAGIRNVKNPIKCAREVMQHSKHVMLMYEGAELFAEKQGLDIVDPAYFYTKERFSQLQSIKKSEKSGQLLVSEQFDSGTVGAVALDSMGNLAAATSSGGMTNKKFGRIGDSCIIGAGTYANNATCAVSCTGHGEYFMRALAAHDISALMEYRRSSLKTATKQVMTKIENLGGKGGLIAIDTLGNVVIRFTTEGMFRAYQTSSIEKKIAIYRK